MQAVRPLRAPAARQLRTLHTRPQVSLRAVRQTARRHASTESPTAKGGSSGAIAGGVAGGLTAFLLGYTWYRFSGTKTLVDYAHQSKTHLDNAFKSATEKAPRPSEAVQWLRETVTGYTRFVPGANQYVDQAFQDIEKLQQHHGDKVNKIVSDTYNELKDVTKNGASVAAVNQAWDVLQKCFKRLSDLAGDAAEDLLNEHPELKDKVGGRYKQLRQMADQYGPEAKQQVDDTIRKVQDIIKGGLSSENIDKARKLVEEKVQDLQKYGEKAWEEGLKRAQPVLDKYPDLKQTINQNKDKLLQGDLGQLWDKVQQASQTGNTQDAKNFIQEQVQKASSSATGGLGGIENFINSFMGGSGKDLTQKFQQLQELGEKHGKEAENLIKSAFEDVKKVLDQKVQEGKELKDRAQKDAGSSGGS